MTYFRLFWKKEWICFSLNNSKNQENIFINPEPGKGVKIPEDLDKTRSIDVYGRVAVPEIEGCGCMLPKDWKVYSQTVNYSVSIWLLLSKRTYQMNLVYEIRTVPSKSVKCMKLMNSSVFTTFIHIFSESWIFKYAKIDGFSFFNNYLFTISWAEIPDREEQILLVRNKHP